jgi:hypothetical protein
MKYISTRMNSANVSNFALSCIIAKENMPTKTAGKFEVDTISRRHLFLS